MRKKMRRLTWGLILILSISLLIGCSAQTATPTPAPVQSPEAEQSPVVELTPAPAGFPVHVTDYNGNVITIQEKPQSIVSLAPATTEVLFALGAGDRVVGVTSLCDYPPEAAPIDKVGDFEGPNVELILAKAPDLVISGGYMHEDAMQTLTEAGITVLPIEAESFQNVYASIENIGLATGTADAAGQIIADIQAGVGRVQAQVKDLPAVKAFYMLSYGDEIWTGSAGTFIHDMIGYAGGVNTAADAETPWTRYSAEAIVAGDPEVIVCDTYVDVDAVKADPALQSVSAIVNDRVYAVSDTDIFTLGGPRLIQGLEELAGMLHPELQ